MFGDTYSDCCCCYYICEWIMRMPQKWLKSREEERFGSTENIIFRATGWGVAAEAC